MAKLGVVGFTGYSGKNITSEALRRGHAVIGLSRHQPKYDVGNVEVRTGSIEDIGVIEQVFRDADVVLVAVHASSNGKPFLINLVPSLLSHAVRYGKRIGVIGGAGSLLVAEGGPRLLDSGDSPSKKNTDSQAMSDVLDALRITDTSADWFFVSPSLRYGAHAPGIEVGSYRLGGDVLLRSSSGVSEISGPDFALAILDEIETPRHHRERFTVVAP